MLIVWFTCHENDGLLLQRTAVRLLPREKNALFRSLALLVLATFKIVIQMTMDYSLYWMLITVRKYGRLSLQLDRKTVFTEL